MTNTNNSKRVATAVLLACFSVAGILLLDSSWFSVVVGLIAAVATWEWCQLSREKFALWWDSILILFVGVGVPAVLIFPFILPWFVGGALLWWMCISVLIVLVGRRSNPPGWQPMRWQALVIILPAAIAIAGLHATGSDGRWYVLVCLLIIWTTDTCAYIVGRVCGKRLLSPGISPAKTVEGAVGGLAGALIVGLIAYEMFPIEMIFQRVNWLVLVTVTAVFSIIGDLTESTYKRAAGVKDSGRILPGHGGILDRIDSTLASSPVFVAGILFAGR